MKRLFYILFCLCLWSCSDKSSEAPENLIPEDKMVLILADVHIAEAQVEQQQTYPDTAVMTFNAEQEKILKKYKVNRKQFRDTYNYYLKNLTAMDKMYEAIVDTLSVREAKARGKSGNAAPENAEDERMVEPDVIDMEITEQ